MTIPFQKLPDHLKSKAAPEILVGRDWYYYGSRVETLGEEELKRWIPADPHASASGNDSTSGMMKIADVCKYPKGGIQRLKRQRADILLASRADLSDRELARLAGVSHTYIAKRRRVATNASPAC